MTKRLFLLTFWAICAMSCSVLEDDKSEVFNGHRTYYAALEQPSTPETKVYVDDNLRLHWDAGDLINVFDGYNYGFRNRFKGETGSTSGEFENEEENVFVVGDNIDFICAVYPYVKNLQLDNKGCPVNYPLPSVQTYRENSFGKGASTLISMGEIVPANETPVLAFKHVCGYLSLKLYGDDVAVSSIVFEGNKGESIAGMAKIGVSLDEAPSVESFTSPESSITLKCDEPVTVGNTAETATAFWLVIPPTKFEDGFTVTVKYNNGEVFQRKLTRSFEINRGCLSRFKALKVE